MLSISSQEKAELWRHVLYDPPYVVLCDIFDSVLPESNRSVDRLLSLARGEIKDTLRSEVGARSAEALAMRATREEVVRFLQLRRDRRSERSRAARPPQTKQEIIDDAPRWKEGAWRRR